MQLKKKKKTPVFIEKDCIDWWNFMHRTNIYWETIMFLAPQEQKTT